MKTRAAVPEDAAGLAAAHLGAWRAGYRGVMPDAYLDGLDADRFTTNWSRILADPGELVLIVGELDGDVIGFAGVSASRDDDATADIGELQSLNLDPAYWGAGHGSALTRAAMVCLAKRGHTIATLWVVEGNARARRTYARLGWIPDGAMRTETFGGGEVTEVRLRIALTTAINVSELTS